MQALAWLGMAFFKATRFGGPVQQGYDSASEGPNAG